MKKYRIYKLDFGNSPLHLSRGRNDYHDSVELLHSDSLKSALFIAAMELFGDTVANSNFFYRFTISSAFPYFKDELFFPRPFVRTMKIHGLADEKQGKPLKKIKYFGRSYFQRHLLGIDSVNDTIPISDLVDDGVFLSNHSALNEVKSGNLKSVIYKTVRQRVSIPRLFDDANAADSDSIHPVPFYFEQVHFSPGAGLFIMADFPETDDATDSMLQACLRWLGDQGVGTDRSVGCGSFCLSDSSWIDFEFTNAPTHQVSLSLYCPNKDEINNADLSLSSYHIVKRAGWIAGSSESEYRRLRRKSVHMFSEGSVFPYALSRRGKLTDLKPEVMKNGHPVYRCGQPIFLPIKVNE